MRDPYETQQREDARQILRCLALGMDPTSGLLTPENPVLREPEVIRALFLGIEALTDHELSTPPDTEPHPESRVGFPWLPEEDQKLRNEFAAGVSIQIIIESHHRTQGAIAARLVHLDLVSDRKEARRLFSRF